MNAIDLYEAKTNLSSLVDRAAAGMPDLPSDALGVGAGFDGQDLRMLRHGFGGVRMDVRFAAAGAKVLVLRDGHVLVAEEPAWQSSTRGRPSTAAVSIS